VARVLGKGKVQQLFLQQSLGTKDLASANRLAKPILMKFDRVIAQAETLSAVRPPRDSLSAHEIRAIAEGYYFSLLEQDAEERREGTGSEATFQAIAKQLQDEGVEFRTPFTVGSVPAAGLSDREVHKRTEALEGDLAMAKRALARGDISEVAVELADLLDIHRINLDQNTEAYRKLGMSVLEAHVRGLNDIARRDAGEAVQTPEEPANLSVSGGLQEGPTVTTALAGWLKETTRPEGTVSEYTRAVALFVQLHGDLHISAMRRSHALKFRDALRAVPRRRPGPLAKAPLPELAEYGTKHPEVQKNSAATVNKQMTAVQSVHTWAKDNCIFPDEDDLPRPFESTSLNTLRPRERC
jgi:hypothetical protein